MFEQFTPAAGAAVDAAHQEAQRRGDRRISTEHLLLGLLHPPGSAAARTLGTDLTTARAALDALDRTALTAIGIDAEGVERSPVPASRKRVPYTSGARAVIKRTVTEARRTGSRSIGPAHLLAAILHCRLPDPAAELLAAVGFDPGSATDPS